MPRRERTEADRLLDRARDGDNVPAWQIRFALFLTGDLVAKPEAFANEEDQATEETQGAR